MMIQKVWALLAGCVLLATPGFAAEPVTPVPEEVQKSIDENTKLALSTFGKLRGGEFDFSESSIEWVDGFINRNRRDDPGAMADVIGSYLGDAIIKHYKGRWVEVGDSVGVELEDGFVAFPIAKAHKQIVNGPEDSILSFYRAIPVLLKQRKEKAAPAEATPKTP